MCGIVGYYAPGRPRRSHADLVAMMRSLHHRGPDDEGYALIDPRTGSSWSRRAFLSREERATTDDGISHEVGIGHCRFSIVDRSDAGHQPFWNEARDLVLSFNGEIYNHVELREELEKRGHRFRSRSDTEVLLHAWEEWEHDALPRLVGFWSFALYDLRRRRLVLSRDRIGKSPLYWCVRDRVLYWASEVQALRRVTGVDAFPVREAAVHDFVQSGWRDTDGRTFYDGIRSLDAASYAVVRDDLAVRPERFWQLPRTRASEREIPIAQAEEAFREMLEAAVRVRERADVKVAMELSGGLDSSSLVALRAARDGASPIPVYTVKFDEPSADEEPFARRVVERFPEVLEHRVIRPPEFAFWDEADSFVPLIGEPFHSPNLLTNHAVRRRIRDDGHGVVIVGSGGDELLAGYPHEYRVPYLLQLAAQHRWGRLARELHHGNPGELRVLLARGLRSSDWTPNAHKQALLPHDAAPARLQSQRFDARMLENWERWKLPYWLRSGNNATYGVPIETRAPFLDHRLAELVFRLPASYLIRDGWHKALLRRALSPLLPPEVTWRRQKMGFPFPITTWLQASKPAILRHVAGCEVPGLRTRSLAEHYDAIAAADPLWLWRFASVVLWHRRCNLGETLSAG